MSSIKVVNPIEFPTWDDLLLTHPETTFFHTAAWAKVLSESYGYKPLYFTIIENGQLAGLIPVMEIDSLLTGKRGVSLPFTDFCRPFADTRDIFNELMNCLMQHGQRAGWRYVDLRGGKDFLDDTPSYAEHFTHILGINGSPPQLNNSFRDSTNRNIRKSEREGVTITIGRSRDYLKKFYDMHCHTRKHHGLPPQPWSFFQNIQKHIMVSKDGIVVLAVYQGRPIAGAVFFLYRNQGLFKFGASDRSVLYLRANNLVMWEAIRWLSRNGFSGLHFGRTDVENTGLGQFKRGWGTKERRIQYYRYDLKKERFVSNAGAAKKYYKSLRHIPIPLMRLTGTILYRHVG
jgi:hypothetical protein